MLRFYRLRFLFSEVKINSKEFSFQEVKQMCSMLNTPYHLFNEQVDIYDDIKLLDQNNKVIGVYRPDAAKKKVAQLGRDLVLFNPVSKPIICKALAYRHGIVSRFYNQLVMKKKQMVLNANSLLKSVRLNPNSTDNELKIKANQVLELVKKNSQVRLFIRSKRIQDEDKVLQKIESLKALLHGKVKVVANVEEIGNKQQEEEQEEQEVDEKFYTGADRRRKGWEFTVESLLGEFQIKLDKTVQEKPEESIRKFMSGYVDEDDHEMKQLKYDIKKERYESRGKKIVKTTDENGEPIENQEMEIEQWREKFKEDVLFNLYEIKKKNYQLFLDLRLRERLRQLGVTGKKD